MFKIFTAMSENKELKEKLAASEAKITQYESELAQKAEEINEISSQKQNLAQSSAQHDAELSQLKNQLENLQQRNQGLESQLKAQEAQIQQQQSETERLQTELNQAQSQAQNLAQVAPETADQSAQLQALENEVARLKQDLATAQQKALKLEFQKQELEKSQSQAAESPPSSAPASGHRPEETRILIVDDSATTRTLTQKILQSYNYQVSLAKDGQEGKDAFQKEEPNLVITDIEMPHLDGFELTHWIKNLSAQRETPVILITSLADEDFQERGREAGAAGFITKNNFNQKAFMQAIENCIGPRE